MSVEPWWKRLLMGGLRALILVPLWLFVSLLVAAAFLDEKSRVPSPGGVDFAFVGVAVVLLPLWIWLIDRRFPKGSGKRALSTFLWFLLATGYSLYVYQTSDAIGGWTWFGMIAVPIVSTVLMGSYGLPPSAGRDTTHGSARTATIADLEAHPDISFRAEKATALTFGGLTLWGDRKQTAAEFKRLDRRFSKQGGWGVWYQGEYSLLTVGPAGSGKGIYSIIPNLATYGGSVLCIDPKGENCSVTARQRSNGGPVFALDPWEIARVPPQIRASFNPIAGLADAGDEAIADTAGVIADALVERKPESKSDDYWDDEAEALLRGLVIQAVTAEPPERQNLLTVREYLSYDPERWESFLDSMGVNTACGGMAANVAAEFRSKADREASSVLSSVHRHTRFMDNPRMRKVLGKSSFGLTDLKAAMTSVYLCLPNQQIGAMSRWLRMLVSVAVAGLMGQRGGTEVLLLLDEFPALGRLPIIERAVAEARGYGVKVWPFVQDLNQLKSIYGENWQTFVANAGLFQVIGVNDQFTAEYISQRIGQTTVTTKSTSYGKDATTTSFGSAGRALFAPDEVIQLVGGGQQILFARQCPMIGAKALPYYELAWMKGLYDPNPMHEGV